MRTRIRTALLGAVTLLAAACGSTPDAAPFQLPSKDRLPVGATIITTAPNQRADKSCGDPAASLRPGARPQPGAMPAGSTMAAIVASGRIKVGVDQNQFLFGFRNPDTSEIEGFDIDIAHEIARDLFGDPDRVALYPIDSANRATALKNRDVDVVVQNFTPTCSRRKDVQFSSVYFETDQRVLVTKGSGIHSAADLGGKKVCGIPNSTTLDAVFALPKRPIVIGIQNWGDCLTALQRGEVDAASTDLPLLYGLEIQDHNLEVVGDPMASDVYAIGIQQDKTDLVRFVNGVLERVRADGTWQRLYNQRLSVLGPSNGPPAARYSD
ncbi:glutamate ABC transporter substrate-binding protein [Nocardia seriolae]|uniref:ABC transporter substrate-binding protein n=1 Tax=Nocardia seriolae TaxID=37332 RepID=A0A0B8NBW2_9NOCA|nr:glutamate ABC transporter substrate-binding protein [Nocardia seriolae]APA98035.1 Major cell-binding factor [Nocardia seriolae]MTJ62735.1 transporter substrate-binding domain-containing protein [Nocardia seriolae]MTJ74419.1 transporter substrate-binding domain-containing protein [Nocardia seriolae]MTJ87772.1 transporter substrate-binding domain-containing protein [Nocardia seriolae]MTK31765.1 transporter substrate-binding domain-containing protein [Nocardia seriolae]